ncbi:hypothetical protein [Alienimonas sp. DA493]|uniref:hypothetical protein n=1 Tax=Alienimonas sp. DA493 TaxID=3373605 RepID=UPI003754C90A
MPTADCPDRETNDAPRGPRQAVEDRIEQARDRLALGFSRGELTRELADEWNLTRRTVRRYLDRAGRRNRELVGKAPADALADALTFWRGLLRDAMEERDAGRAGLADGDGAAGRDADRLAKRVRDAERRAATYRDRIDRLLGLHSSATTADRLTVAGTAPDGGAGPRAKEPADPDRAIRDLLKVVG